MVLTAGYIALAQKLQEAAQAMSTEDVRTRLADCLNDTFRGTGSWCYVVAVFGDDKSGDVVYSCDGDLKKASYTIAAGATKVETTTAIDVQPLTTYEPESADVTEAGRRNSSRDLRQLQTIHDASMGLGATCGKRESRAAGAGTPAYKPANSADSDSRSASQGSDSRGAGRAAESIAGVVRETLTNSTLKLEESAGGFIGEVPLVESSRTSYPIKLISPGTGSTAHYPAAVLERDGPKVFKKGTLMFWNHPTAAEESSRPEGDLNNLAAILTKDAEWQANGVKGPGLYSEAKVMADYAQKIEERAPHIGLSIRAGGIGSGKFVNGKPELSSIDYAESVDYVTRAGRGGMALAEAARGAGIEIKEALPANQQTGENAMDDKEAKELRESLDQSRTINRLLLGRLLKEDARREATALVEAVDLPPISQRRIVEAVISRDLPEKDHTLDLEKFREAVNAEIKSEGVYVASLMGTGGVHHMGTSIPMVESDPVKAQAIRDRAVATEKDLRESEESVFGVITGGKSDVAKLAAKGRVA